MTVLVQQLLAGRRFRLTLQCRASQGDGGFTDGCYAEEDGEVDEGLVVLGEIEVDVERGQSRDCVPEGSSGGLETVLDNCCCTHYINILSTKYIILLRETGREVKSSNEYIK